MKTGLILVGEPMGLMIAQSEGAMEDVKDYTLSTAGAELNVAIGVSRLNQRAAYLTKLGNDPFGKLIVKILKENGIGTELVSFSEDRSTGFMMKNKVSKGDPEICYFRRNSAASILSKEDVEKIDFSQYTHLHLTGIFPALSETTRETSYYLIQKARENNLVVSFDPNLRPQLWASQEEMVRVINDLAFQSDIVFPGTAEGKILMGSDNPKEINRFYREHGVKTVITKCGGDGAYVTDGDTSFMSHGFSVEEIVDTVGAGDGFAAGTLSALMEGMNLRDAVRRGNALGAIQVMSAGDNEGLPTPEKLNEFYAQR